MKVVLMPEPEHTDAFLSLSLPLHFQIEGRTGFYYCFIYLYTTAERMLSFVPGPVIQSDGRIMGII